MANPDGRIAYLERIERDSWESLCRAAPQDVAHELGLEVHRFGETQLSVCAGIDQGQFNHLSGIVADNSETRDAISEAVSRFRRAGIKNPFIQIPPGFDSLESEARRHGLVPRKRPWVKFEYRAVASAEPKGEVEVVPAVKSDAVRFGEIIAKGFSMPPIMARWLAGLVGRAGWTCYLAFDQGNAIGGAALYLRDGTAWLGVGATLEEARKRGAQSTLLRRRIRDAQSAGARIITTETGKPLEGEDHPSYRNIIRSGFELAYERNNWTFPTQT